MALVVEDGTGLADAESLASEAEYRARQAKLGVDVTSEAQADVEARLRKATEFMARYRDRWSGYRATSTQALDHPRVDMPIRDTIAGGFYPSTVVHALAKNACIDLAYKAKDGPLEADLEPRIKREKTDVLETEFDVSSPQEVRYPAIETLLKPLFSQSGSSITSVPLVRG